jgi:hypothetical protein
MENKKQFPWGRGIPLVMTFTSLLVAAGYLSRAFDSACMAGQQPLLLVFLAAACGTALFTTLGFIRISSTEKDATLRYVVPFIGGFLFSIYGLVLVALRTNDVTMMLEAFGAILLGTFIGVVAGALLGLALSKVTRYLEWVYETRPIENKPT